MSPDGSGVAISGRSIGKVNVQIILETLGGGGHATMAAARLTDVTIEEGYDKLKKTIENFMKEE